MLLFHARFTACLVMNRNDDIFIRYALRYWQTRTHCRGHIVAHDVSWTAQTGKHLLRTQNVSEQNQKHFLCPGHKICVRNKCCARGQTGKHLCRQQCVLVCQGLYIQQGECDLCAFRIPCIYLARDSPHSAMHIPLTLSVILSFCH